MKLKMPNKFFLHNQSISLTLPIICGIKRNKFEQVEIYKVYVRNLTKERWLTSLTNL